jgi:GH15 family glucan-1,4-alpha-glucosidase
MALRIEDYAMIGDCETAALVGRDGSIDWLCWPRFDSAACFAALLGTSDNGRWLLAPKSQPLEVTRRYRPGTLILETEFRTETGTAVVIDFMPPADSVADLVRIVRGLSGQVTFQTELAVRFDYGATVPWVTRIEDSTIEAIAGPDCTGKISKPSASLWLMRDNQCPSCCPMGVLSKVRQDRSIRWRRSNARRHFGANGVIDVRALGLGRMLSSVRSSP